jgi:hypothetical protein
MTGYRRRTSHPIAPGILLLAPVVESDESRSLRDMG